MVVTWKKNNFFFNTFNPLEKKSSGTDRIFMLHEINLKSTAENNNLDNVKEKKLMGVKDNKFLRGKLKSFRIGSKPFVVLGSLSHLFKPYLTIPLPSVSISVSCLHTASSLTDFHHRQTIILNIH